MPDVSLPPRLKRKVEIFPQVEDIERKPAEDKDCHRGEKKTTTLYLPSFILFLPEIFHFYLIFLENILFTFSMTLHIFWRFCFVDLVFSQSWHRNSWTPWRGSGTGRWMWKCRRRSAQSLTKTQNRPQYLRSESTEKWNKRELKLLWYFTCIWALYGSIATTEIVLMVAILTMVSMMEGW